MKPAGLVCFWKYKTDGWLGSEWHFAADDAGCQSVLAALKQMAASGAPQRLRLQLNPVPPHVLELPDFNSPHESITTLEFVFDPSAALTFSWQIVENNGAVEISFGKAMLGEWRDALNSVARGGSIDPIGLQEDYTVTFWSA